MEDLLQGGIYLFTSRSLVPLWSFVSGKRLGCSASYIYATYGIFIQASAAETNIKRPSIQEGFIRQL